MAEDVDPVASRNLDEELYEQVQRFARHVCGRMGGSWEVELDADDLAQESFARLLDGGLEKARAAKRVPSYLYTLVRTTMLMRVRSTERRRRREEIALPETLVEPAFAQLEVDSILRRLDEACRDLLRRVFLEEVPYPQLATQLGLAEASVRARVSRCVGKARGHV